MWFQCPQSKGSMFLLLYSVHQVALLETRLCSVAWLVTNWSPYFRSDTQTKNLLFQATCINTVYWGRQLYLKSYMYIQICLQELYLPGTDNGWSGDLASTKLHLIWQHTGGQYGVFHQGFTKHRGIVRIFYIKSLNNSRWLVGHFTPLVLFLDFLSFSPCFFHCMLTSSILTEDLKWSTAFDQFLLSLVQFGVWSLSKYALYYIVYLLLYHIQTFCYDKVESYLNFKIVIRQKSCVIIGTKS